MITFLLAGSGTYTAEATTFSPAVTDSFTIEIRVAALDPPPNDPPAFAAADYAFSIDEDESNG